jgi:hypothetical protein
MELIKDNNDYHMSTQYSSLKLNYNHKPERTVTFITFTFQLMEIFCGFNRINAMFGKLWKVCRKMAPYSLSCINEIIQYTLSGAAILHSFSQTCCSLLNNQNVWSSIGDGRLRFDVDNAPLYTYSRALNKHGPYTLITVATPHTVSRNASLF